MVTLICGCGTPIELTPEMLAMVPVGKTVTVACSECLKREADLVGAKVEPVVDGVIETSSENN